MRQDDRRPAAATSTTLAATGTVYRKEMVDAFRDRRTLATVLLSAVLLGPAVLLVLAAVVADLEAKAEARTLALVAPGGAPTFVNFAERQGFAVRAVAAGASAAGPARGADNDPADGLAGPVAVDWRDATATDAVVVVGRDFERRLRAGDAPVIEIVSDSANARSAAGAARAARLVEAFGRERASLALALRGVDPQIVRPVTLEERDLASRGSRAAQSTGLLPFFVLTAVLTGALNAALDTTAGERERGSLEPLLANPPPRVAIVVGKWAAVTSVGFLIAVLACLSFLPAQRFLASDTLAAMFRYGPREVLGFIAVLAPFAGAAAALLMAVAIRCRSFKEAQAATALVTLGVSVLPLVNLLSLGQESRWFLWVPALAQNVLMTRVLKGEALALLDVAPSYAVSVAIGVASLAFVAASLRRVAAR